MKKMFKKRNKDLSNKNNGKIERHEQMFEGGVRIKNNNKIKIITSILLTILLITGLSYAYFYWSYNGTSTHNITTPDVSFRLLESNKEIFSITPMTDEEGMNSSDTQGNILDFEIKSETVANMDVKYTVRLQKLDIDAGMEQIPDNEVKVYVEDFSGNTILKPTKVSELEDYILFEKTHKHNSTKKEIKMKYKLKIWLDESVSIFDNENRQFKFKIGVVNRQLKQETGETYNLVYNTDGGSEVTGTTFKEGESVTITSSTPTKSGYTFKGWSRNKNATTATYKAGDKVTFDNVYNNKVTLYAVWSANGYKLNINKGTGVSTIYYKINDDTSYTSSESNVSLDVKYNKKYYYYGVASNGYTIGTCTEEKPCSGTMGLETVTKELNANINTYTISYNLDGGTNPSSGVTTSYNVTTSTFNLPTPTKTGYTFDGWYTNSDLSGTKVTQIAKGSTGNKTYYAKWTLNTYNINYELNGGTLDEPSQSWDPPSATFGQEINIHNPEKSFKITGDANGTGATVGNSTTGTIYESEISITNYNESTAMYKGDVSDYELVAANFPKTVDALDFPYFTYKDLGDPGTTVNFEFIWKEDTVITPTITKTGYDCGWATSKTATDYEVASGGKYTVGNDTPNNITLYGVCKAKSKKVTVSISYDTSTYSAPSDTNKATESLRFTADIDLDSLGSNFAGITIPYGQDKTIYSSPAVPSDRYTLSSVNCTNGITATFTQGEDEENMNCPESSTTAKSTRSVCTINYRTDTIKLTNNSDTTTASTCTITYKPKWEGIANVSYENGDKVTYAGKEWTSKVIGSANSIGLALNEVVTLSSGATGSYTSDVSKVWTNTTVNNEIANGATYGDLTTDSGISTNLTDGNYWTSSDSVHLNAFNTYSVSSTKYVVGSVTGREKNVSNSGYPGDRDVDDNLTTTNYAEGIYATDSSFIHIAQNQFAIVDGSYSTSTSENYYSRRYTKFKLTGTSASSTKLGFTIEKGTYSNGTYTATSTITPSSSTYRLTAKNCGANIDISNHKAQVVFYAKNSTNYYYGNQASGTGWGDGATSFSTSDAESYAYSPSSGNGNLLSGFAGYATTDCSNKCESDDDCNNCTYNSTKTTYHRKYYFGEKTTYCKQKTTYSTTAYNLIMGYRPYIIVRMR